MLSENYVQDFISEFNKTDRSKTFAEFLAVLFKDKFIEIYLGDSYEEVSMEQTSMSYPAVFCGKVIGAFKECLVISSVYVHNKKMQLGNLMFINERAIRALNEIDGHGVMEDMFLRSKESLDIKANFIDR
jgi:hypothetical protein